MWNLIKTILFFCFIGCATYGVFFVQLGQMTLAGHIAEVWNSTVIQKKMQQMRAGVESQLAQKLNRALANKHHNGSGETEISDSDRQELETLLRKSQ